MFPRALSGDAGNRVRNEDGERRAPHTVFDIVPTCGLVKLYGCCYGLLCESFVQCDGLKRLPRVCEALMVRPDGPHPGPGRAAASRAVKR